MKVGLVGYPGSGKTTVFNALTGLEAPVGYGGETRLGAVRVPDLRLDRLASLYRPRKTIYSEITFRDLPGERGSERLGLSSTGLHRLREQDALCLVVGDFGAARLAETDAAGDVDSFHDECLFADLEIVSKRLDRLRKERAEPLELAAFARTMEWLEAEKPVRSLEAGDRRFLRGFGLLTDLPLVVVLNVEEERAAEALAPALRAKLEELGAEGVVLSASVEADIASMASEERAEFLEDLGVEVPALDRFVRLAYGALDLVTFFTVGPDEVRAWTIRKGASAREAAGAIHSDMERGFIRAEIVPWDGLLEHGSELGAKKAGALRVEGGNYVVQDGEVMHVRFNV